MGWKIANGFPVQDVRVSLTPPEIPIDYACAVCGRVYKTETGLHKHITDKH